MHYTRQCRLDPARHSWNIIKIFSRVQKLFPKTERVVGADLPLAGRRLMQNLLSLNSDVMNNHSSKIAKIKDDNLAALNKLCTRIEWTYTSSRNKLISTTCATVWHGSTVPQANVVKVICRSYGRSRNSTTCRFEMPEVIDTFFCRMSCAAEA